jgi:hypothetical protein
MSISKRKSQQYLNKEAILIKKPKNARKEDYFTYEQLEKAFRAALGIKAQVAKILGCSYKTINNYAVKYPQLDEIRDEMLQQMLDNAELKLQKKISENNLSAVIFFLKTKGKNRGYTERIENTGKEGGAIQIIDETSY